MHTLAVNDLDANIELDKHTAANIAGGRLRFITSTRDLHDLVYGKFGSPYGRGTSYSYSIKF